MDDNQTNPTMPTGTDDTQMPATPAEENGGEEAPVTPPMGGEPAEESQENGAEAPAEQVPAGDSTVA